MDLPRSPNLHIDKLAAVFSNSLDNIRQKSREEFREILGETIRPLMQIAGNMGFEGGWKLI